MRSSKSRSRNKPNRNRPSTGNVVNRTFDSSGPEGKVRGTPQQIIEKYNQLARDAQLSGDRVATENFQQHAEHYLRLLGEAQKEQEARREEQERQNRERQVERDRERPQTERQQNTGERQGQGNTERDQTRNAGQDAGGHDPARSAQPDVIDTTSHVESGLVETPESQSAPVPPKRPRKPRVKKPAKAEAQSEPAGDQDNGTPPPSGPAEAAE
ncbi:protein of unknown function [Roseovarius marisflavi]|uniref:DUF4167 domain-containing protein n=1 Tax=Roseovarius marisflavi TaxID=1054996 RepID=A0A1M6ZHJ4_9RHOB|nr:DUF4167 domain-containing protein [Roseovarius marisflavi]SHL29937.1 protein of unknown function [Roseovarius marisflavi]